MRRPIFPLFAFALLLGCGGDQPASVDAAFSDGSAPADLAQASVTTKVTVHYPTGGRSLSIRGSGGPLDWSRGVAMQSAGDDTWVWQSATVSTALEWKPLLDDKDWSRGPNYRVAPGATVEVWPHFYATNGKVVTLIQSFHSTKLPNDRTVWAYLPPSYDENARARFPVIYMHDGQNLFDPKLAFGGVEWGVDETLDAGAEDGTIREAIVVGIGNTSARVYEYTPTRDATVGDGGGGDAYLALIADELKPTVDQTLRTRPEREQTLIMGSSLGGLISAHAGVVRPSVFGRVGEMSPSTWWDSDWIIGRVAMTPAAPARPLTVYVDSGDSGPSNDDVTQTTMLAAAYRGVGYQDNVDLLHVVQAGGQHSESYWAQRLPGALRFLLGPRTP